MNTIIKLLLLGGAGYGSFLAYNKFIKGKKIDPLKKLIVSKALKKKRKFKVGKPKRLKSNPSKEIAQKKFDDYKKKQVASAITAKDFDVIRKDTTLTQKEKQQAQAQMLLKMAGMADPFYPQVPYWQQQQLADFRPRYSIPAEWSEQSFDGKPTHQIYQWD